METLWDVRLWQLLGAYSFSFFENQTSQTDRSLINADENEYPTLTSEKTVLSLEVTGVLDDIVRLSVYQEMSRAFQINRFPQATL